MTSLISVRGFDYLMYPPNEIPDNDYHSVVQYIDSKSSISHLNDSYHLSNSHLNKWYKYVMETVD